MRAETVCEPTAAALDVELAADASEREQLTRAGREQPAMALVEPINAEATMMMLRVDGQIVVASHTAQM